MTNGHLSPYTRLALTSPALRNASAFTSLTIAAPASAPYSSSSTTTTSHNTSASPSSLDTSIHTHSNLRLTLGEQALKKSFACSEELNDEAHAFLREALCKGMASLRRSNGTHSAPPTVHNWCPPNQPPHHTHTRTRHNPHSSISPSFVQIASY